MNTKQLYRIIVFSCLVAMGVRANAQVVVDNSLGNAGALNGPNFKIPDTLGKTVGDNLFHSFSEFSLQSGQSATFTGPDSIQNILGRVTGAKVSEIDGLIKSEITDANLYLLNPNGFLIGKNASVDVDGAFTLSTRESLKLGEEGSFNAVNPDQSVFTSAAPDAFGFLGDNPGGAIKFSGSQLIVENPVNLIGGDIRLEDSVIYSKSGGKPTGVNIEGNNLAIVDSQIRNKSTVEVEGVKQGIKIELKGNLEITDTTITEEDGSGVDRGDFIDEIGSEVPFASRVGILGITEEFENPDAIAIGAKKSEIIGGGVYSVNQFREGKLSDSKEPSINLKAKSLQLKQGEIFGIAQSPDVQLTEKIKISKRTKKVTVNPHLFDQLETIKVYLNGEKLIEGADYTLEFDSRGRLKPMNFAEYISNGSLLEVLTTSKKSVNPGIVSLVVEGEFSLSESGIKGGDIIISGGTVGSDRTYVKGSSSVIVNSKTELNLINQTSISSELYATGSVHLEADIVNLSAQSNISGGKHVTMSAVEEVLISDKSTITVGLSDFMTMPDDRNVVLWDSETQFAYLFESSHRSLKSAKSVASRMARLFGRKASDYNVLDLNQPYKVEDLVSIQISGKNVIVDQGGFESRASKNLSALKINSENLIQLSNASEVNWFDQVELDATSVEFTNGIRYQSENDEWGYPTGFLIVRSSDSVNLNELSVGGNLVVKSGNNIEITDIDQHGNYLKLNAENDVNLSSEKNEALSSLLSRRIEMQGNSIQLDQVKLKSSTDLIIHGEQRVDIGASTHLEAKLKKDEVLSINASEVHLNDATVYAESEVFKHNKSKVLLNGEQLLSIKGSSVELGANQLEAELPKIELRGKRVVLDNSKVAQLHYFNFKSIILREYAYWPPFLNGKKITLVKADDSFEMVNDSSIYMYTGDIQINSNDISLKDSMIINETTWPNFQTKVGEIKLDAKGDITLVNSHISGISQTWATRSSVNMKGSNLSLVNSHIGLLDGWMGDPSLLNIDFKNAISMENSEIRSVGWWNPDGNVIKIRGDELIMNDSIIAGTVEGTGKAGPTRLYVPLDNVSLKDSYIGGLTRPLKSIPFEEIATDNSLGDEINLGNGENLEIPASLGHVKGDNLYHSFRTLGLASGQTVELEIPRGIKNIFIRVTGGEISKLNGIITLDSRGKNITFINEKGFELGPDVYFDKFKFSSIRLGAVEQIDFKDGSKFGMGDLEVKSLSSADAVYDFDSEQLTGDIRMFGASITDYNDRNSSSKTANIGLFSKGLKIVSGGIVSFQGADVNLEAENMEITKFSSIRSYSPLHSKGGAIKIKSSDLKVNRSDILAKADGGLGGDILIDTNKFYIYDGMVEAGNYFSTEGFEFDKVQKYKSGSVVVNADTLLEGDRALVRIISNTTGGAGDLTVNAGTLTGSGSASTAFFDAGIGFDLIAYRGGAGQLRINAEKIDGTQISVGNAAMSDRGVEIDKANLEKYGDVDVVAKDISVEHLHFTIGTEKSNSKGTLGDLSVQAENDIVLGDLRVYRMQDIKNRTREARGMGGDITFKAKNILTALKPADITQKSKYDILPTIQGSGLVKFEAEEKLELGFMRFETINVKPTRNMTHVFKAKNIEMGMPLGDDFKGNSSIDYSFLDQAASVEHRIIISAEEDVRLVSGVNLDVPSLSLEAGNLYINNSKITLEGNVESRINVRGEMELLGGGTSSRSVVI